MLKISMLVFTAIFTLGFWTKTGVKKPDLPFPENTAAPGELTCGRAPCHNIAPNLGTAQLSISANNGATTYLADNTYEIKITLQNPQTQRNGFQIVALDEANQNVGTWLLTQPSQMGIISGIGLPSRKYVTHRAAGNQQNIWQMQWKAPATNAGKITFYASSLASNNNGQNTGDQLYTQKITLDFATSATDSPADFSQIEVFPMPSAAGFWVKLPQEFSAARFQLLDAAGSVVKKWEEERPAKAHFLATEGLPPGIYFLSVEQPAAGLLAVKKVFLI